MCAQSPDQIEASDCLSGYDRCFTAISDYGHINRDCYHDNHYYCQENDDYDDDNYSDESNCTICFEDNCNNQIYPEDQLKCYHCSGINCNTTDQLKLLPCHQVKDDNECFTYSGANEYIRGCISDSNFKYLCKDNADLCSKCNTTGCNNENLALQECYSCSSTDGLCETPNNFDKLNKVKCEPDMEGNLCYTHVDKTNIVTRGCVRDKIYRKNHGHFIDICKNDKCNNKLIEKLNCPQCNMTTDRECSIKEFKSEWIKKNGCDDFTSVCHLKCNDINGDVFRGCGKTPPHSFNCTFCYENCDKIQNSKVLSCYECRSDTNPNCINNVKKIRLKTCSNEGRVGCFTENFGGLIMRGCQESLNEHEYFQCKNNEKCKLCNFNKCNSENSADFIPVTSLILITFFSLSLIKIL